MTRKKYDIETLFKALADRTRLRLISLMGDSEVCVCFFVAILKTSQPKISRHLAYLRRAGIVAARRDRKSTRLNSSHGYISYAVFCLKKQKSPGLYPPARPALPRRPPPGSRRLAG